LTHDSKQHHLSPLFGTGDVSYCSANSSCKKVAHGFKFPNGLHVSSEGLLYVPSAAIGGITVFRPKPDGSLVRVHYIDLDYPIDNLTEDQNGDIWAATLPKAPKALAAFEDPLNRKSPPATVWRVRRLDRDRPDRYRYELTKIIEDAHGEQLPGMTTVVHDAETGTLFMSGEYLPAFQQTAMSNHVRRRRTIHNRVQALQG
jgi:arylesterase / paraoxonase